MKILPEFMSYITIDKEDPKRGDEELENLFLNFNFLNLDISLNIHFPNISHNYRKRLYMEGTVSQNFYLGPSINFMNSRKIIMEK